MPDPVEQRLRALIAEARQQQNGVAGLRLQTALKSYREGRSELQERGSVVPETESEAGGVEA